MWFPFMREKQPFIGYCHFSTDKPDGMLTHSFRPVSAEELQNTLTQEGYLPPEIKQ